MFFLSGLRISEERLSIKDIGITGLRENIAISYTYETRLDSVEIIYLCVYNSRLEYSELFGFCFRC